MKKLKNIYIILFSLTFAFFGCQEDEYRVGEIITPTNISVSVEVVGTDASNPNGDGSGFVTFTATADNEINYQFDFGDGKTGVAPTGITTHRYTEVGVNTFTVIVNATGTAGVGTSTSLEVTVYSSFTDVESENLLTGASGVNDVGASKKWYWQADVSGFVSLGPVTDDYGNGEFAYGAWWPGPDAWADDRRCFFESNEFVFTRTANGITFEQTVGPAYVPGTYAGTLGVGGDQCHDDTVATTMFGVKNVSFSPSSSKAAIEGSYNDEPYTGTTFEISDGGFMGWLVSTASTYDIISISEDELIVRIIEDGGGYAWYKKFTSTKPVEGAGGYQYNTLAWEDDFNIDGAPDAAKWTYDLGTGSGGWGNGESQEYTNNAENVIVDGGSLKITAKANGGGYTSARLKSQGLYNFTYGRVEVRAKLPSAQGTWPAIWMLGSNFPTVSWPHSGEIDIMEQTGQDKATVLGTCHWYNTAGSANASYGETTSITNASTEFHIYTLEWSADSIKIFLDDVKYYEMANDSALPFNADFFLILNVAMGGTLGGTIDPAFTEDMMEVDYVKVYQ